MAYSFIVTKSLRQLVSGCRPEGPICGRVWPLDSPKVFLPTLQVRSRRRRIVARISQQSIARTEDCTDGDSRQAIPGARRGDSPPRQSSPGCRLRRGGKDQGHFPAGVHAGRRRRRTRADCRLHILRSLLDERVLTKDCRRNDHPSRALQFLDIGALGRNS